MANSCFSSSSSSSTTTIAIDQGQALLAEPLLQNSNHGGKDLESHEDRQHGEASVVRTCFNGLNALSGVGLLSIPYALSEGGWFSLSLLLIVAIICFYTGLLLQKCMEAHVNVRSYPDVGELAFGYKGRLAVSVFMYLELYLVAIGFLILEGDNLDKLFPNTHVRVFGTEVEGKQLFVTVVALVVLPTTWLKNLGVLAYISAGGVLASIVVVAAVFWVAVVDRVGFREKGSILKLTGLPTALGLYTFCYCGHAVFPTLYNSMKQKKKFPKVLSICFLLCTLNYGSMAIFGYLMYGESVESQITLNLPDGKISSKIAIYTTLVTPITKFAIMITPVATAVEERLTALTKTPAVSSTGIRSLLVLGTVIVALSVPFFGYLMALIGSFLSIICSVLLPCLCYLKIYRDSQINKYELSIIIGITVFGILVAVLGTYSSVMQIINEF